MRRAAAATRRMVPLLLLLAAGCTLLTAMPPQVEIRNVSLRGAGLLDEVLAVELCVSNPNATALNFRRADVGLDVENAPFAQGQSEGAVLLPPRASTLVPFQVVVTNRNLGPQLLGVLRTGGVEYRVHGTVTLTGALALDVPFSRRGHLDLLSAGQSALTYGAAPEATRCGLPPS